MESITLPQIATYISYIFVTIAYAVKVRKYFSLPKNLRWELYPVATEVGDKLDETQTEEPGKRHLGYGQEIPHNVGILP